MNVGVNRKGTDSLVIVRKILVDKISGKALQITSSVTLVRFFFW